MSNPYYYDGNGPAPSLPLPHETDPPRSEAAHISNRLPPPTSLIPGPPEPHPPSHYAPKHYSGQTQAAAADTPYGYSARHHQATGPQPPSNNYYGRAEQYTSYPPEAHSSQPLPGQHTAARQYHPSYPSQEQPQANYQAGSGQPGAQYAGYHYAPTGHAQLYPETQHLAQQSQPWHAAPPHSSTGQPASTSRRAEIPNLIDADRAHTIPGMKFSLSMRQQPRAARACGSGERDRRNIDPPPVIQLHIENPKMEDDEINRYLRYENYVMNCWIYDESGTVDTSHMPSEYRYQRRLTGSLVGTPFYGKDDNGQDGCFFAFSDLSVRTLGRYRLKFNLIMLDTNARHKHFPILAEVFSESFDVFTAKEFPGISESSRLVRTLREQGCIIAIKKGNEKRKKGKSRTQSEDEEEEDEIGDDEDDLPGAGGAQGKRRRPLGDY